MADTPTENLSFEVVIADPVAFATHVKNLGGTPNDLLFFRNSLAGRLAEILTHETGEPSEQSNNIITIRNISSSLVPLVRLMIRTVITPVGIEFRERE